MIPTTANALRKPEPSAAALIPSPASTAPAQSLAEFKTVQYVFRLQLDHGNCTLEKMEEVSGAFGRERMARWQTGMLCCRLVSEDGRVVGERTLQAPDYVCVVLDPSDESKAPAAARLTSDGPATFQIRFPQITDAVRLEVHRIATEARPANAAIPVGPLIASIAIPPK